MEIYTHFLIQENGSCVSKLLTDTVFLMEIQTLLMRMKEIPFTANKQGCSHIEDKDNIDIKTTE